MEISVSRFGRLKQGFQRYVKPMWQRYTGELKPYRVALVDSFAVKQVDIDGDGVPDLSHGDFIRRLLKGRNPFLQVVPFKLSGPQAFDAGLLEQLQELLSKIRKGVRFDAVNMSLSYQVKFEDFRIETDLKSGKETVIYAPKAEAAPAAAVASIDLVRALIASRTDPLTPSNILKYRDKLVECARTDTQLAKNKTGEIIDTLEQIQTAGVPVFLSAGNVAYQQGGDLEKRNDYFNMHSLAKGITTVGAVQANGVYAPYSVNNPFVTVRARGTYTIHKVPGGYDINNDGLPEVEDFEVSNKPRITYLPYKFTEGFEHKPVALMLASPQEIDAVEEAIMAGTVSEPTRKMLETKLFVLEDAHAAGWIPNLTYGYLRGMGEYVVLDPQTITNPGQSINGGVRGVFTKNAKGEAIYSPDGGPHAEAIHYTWGSSWATPTFILDMLHGPASQTD